jgi:hypothetical protein
MINRRISIHTPSGPLHGQLERPDEARGLIIIARAHHAPVDLEYAAVLNQHGFATLTFELLSAHEIQFPDATQNIPRLTQRLLDLLDLTRHDHDMVDLPIAIFANGDTSPATIRASAQRDLQVKVVVCHGGMIDRAGLQSLKLLAAPLLSLFESDDAQGKTNYARAQPHLICPHQTHTLESFDDPAEIAAKWFLRNLPSTPRPAGSTLGV